MSFDAYGCMSPIRILIVEDDVLIGLDVEQVLIAAGYDVCGVATSEFEALALTVRFRPQMAIVDISLSPGDGRVAARQLCDRYGTAVLFATGQCREVQAMIVAGAVACLPKPYDPEDVPAALTAVAHLVLGDHLERLPDHMFALAAA